MSQEARPLLSVIVRRFPLHLEPKIEPLLKKIKQAMVNQPGFVGIQNSLSHQADGCELVTVFGFDSDANLQQWQASVVRKGFVSELDTYSQDNVSHAQFNDLALLQHPKAQLRKIETVAILIFWIVLLGGSLRYVADTFLPGILSPSARHLILISVNVLLISYLFLPWSSILISHLKRRLTHLFK